MNALLCRRSDLDSLVLLRFLLTKLSKAFSVLCVEFRSGALSLFDLRFVSMRLFLRIFVISIVLILLASFLLVCSTFTLFYFEKTFCQIFFEEPTTPEIV